MPGRPIPCVSAPLPCADYRTEATKQEATSTQASQRMERTPLFRAATGGSLVGQRVLHRTQLASGRPDSCAWPLTIRESQRWTTAVNVKLLLPPRQSRGTSYGRLGRRGAPHRSGGKRYLTMPHPRARLMHGAPTSTGNRMRPGNPLVCQDWANTKGAYRFFSNLAKFASRSRAPFIIHRLVGLHRARA
jgi:hypothetical protein